MVLLPLIMTSHIISMYGGGGGGGATYFVSRAGPWF